MTSRMKSILLLLVTSLVAGDAASCALPNVLSPDTFGTKILIKKAIDGAVVSNLCPGMTYKITVTFPQPREYFAKASAGVWGALTGACTNQTSSATPTTNTTLTIATPCDLKTTFVLTLASKVPSTLTFLNKTFTLPVNPLTSCPASRCVATATSAFEGLPVFNLFKSVGVVPNLTSSNVLNFSFTPALPKAVSIDGFFNLLGALEQFKLAKASMLADPTLMLSVLQKLCLAVNQTSIIDAPKAALLAESTKLLTLWPSFWNTSKIAVGGGSSTWGALDVSSVTEAFAAMMPDTIPSLLNATGTAAVGATVKPPAESLLSIMASLGNIAAAASTSSNSATAASSIVPADSIVALLGSYTSFLAAVKNVA